MSGDRIRGAGVQIDWCPRDMVPDLQSFIDTHWQPGHILSRDSELLCWQYRHLQDPERLSVLVARDEDDILGFLGLIQVNFNRYGESLPAAWLATWCTTEHVRSRRVGLALLREALQGPFSMIGCLGFNDTTKGILGGLRFEIRESLPRWVRVISVAPLDSLLADSDEPSTFEAQLPWCASAQRTEPGNMSSTIQILDWSEETASRWDQAWRQRFAPQILGTQRDADYLRWRYVEHPNFRYVTRFAEDTLSGALLGVLVYRVETVRNLGVKVIRVLEFLSNESAGDALARLIIDEGEAEDVAFADFYCSSQTFSGPLEAAGFVRADAMSGTLPSLFQPLEFHPTPLKGAFMVKDDISDDNHTFFDTPSLYVTRSEGDQDRPN